MIAIQSADSVTVILKGKPYTVASDHSRYDELSTAISNRDESTVDSIVNASTSITEVLGTFGDVQLFAGHVTFKGKSVGNGNFLASRILAFQEAGRDIEPLARFMNSVCRNPDQRAIRDLFMWCDKAQMPIDEKGRIIGYKIVRDDFLDHYSGSYDNSPGTTATMPRADCDPNPNQTCSRGLHFCSASYLPNYGPSNKKVILVAVEPEHVTAFPTDYNLAKARACQTTSLHEIDPDTAATFFEGRDQLVYDADTYFAEQYEATQRAEAAKAAEAAGWSVTIDGMVIEAIEPSGQVLDEFDTEDDAWSAVLEEIEDRLTQPESEVDKDWNAPLHPAEFFLEDFLKPLEMSHEKAAETLQMTMGELGPFLREEAPLTAELARRLSAAFGCSADYWLGLQTQYDLEVTLAIRVPVQLNLSERLARLETQLHITSPAGVPVERIVNIEAALGAGGRGPLLDRVAAAEAYFGL